MKWLRPQSGTAAFYRVEVATSPFFVADGKVIERDQLASTEFTASDLRPGVYFWRVRATAASGQTSDWSDPQKFIVATRGTGSHVPVSNLTAELLGGSVYLIRGRSEPGTTIRVAGRETIVPTEGSFQIQITAPAGAQEITVEAEDPQGNSSQYRCHFPARANRGKRLGAGYQRFKFQCQRHVILLTDAHEAPAYELIEALRLAGVKTLIEGCAKLRSKRR